MKLIASILLLAIASAGAATAQRSANIVFIGNSITYGAMHQKRELTAPPAQCALWLSQREGIDTVYFSNCGRSGRTTYHFLPREEDVVPAGDKTYFPTVVASTRQLVGEHPTLPLIFSIMLGTNDTVERKHNSHTSPGDYAANIKTLADTLLRLWPSAQVVLHKPIWYTPDYVTKNGSVASEKSLRLIGEYERQLKKIADGSKQIHIGDCQAYDYFEKNWKTDIVEEKDSRGKSYRLHPNEKGAQKLAEYWGKTLLPVISAAPNNSAEDIKAPDRSETLRGAKFGIIGDSYVRNHREPVENTWHYKFAKKHGMEYYNYGRNGNCIAVDLKQWGTAMYKRYTEMRDDLDYVVVVAGHNDAAPGRADSIGMDAFKERLGILCQGLIERYPKARIFFFTPWTCNAFNGSMREKVVDAMLQVCGSYGIPVFDAARRSNIFATSEQFRKIYFQGGKGTDTAHLNSKGHDRFLPVAENFLMQYIGQTAF